MRTVRDLGSRKGALVLAVLGCLAASVAMGGRAGDDAIDEIVRPAMEKEHIPGVAVGVIRDGTLVLTHVYGTANLETKAPVTPTTPFLIASMSKQFCAESILLLAKEGKLSIDDPVSKYVVGTPSAWSKVTLRNLLSHESGIHDIVKVPGYSFLDTTWDVPRIMAKLAPLPLDFQPGERFSYSNSGYYLLGWIVEKVSGEPLAQFAKEKIFDPAGMTLTHYYRNGEVLPDRAPAYAWSEKTQGYRKEWQGRPVAADGSGAVITTLGDWAKYDASLDKGAPIPFDIQKAMGTGGTLNDGKRVTYGFGWYDDGNGQVHHTGGSYGYSTVFVRDPKDHTTVVIFRNANGGSVVTMGKAVLAAVLAHPELVVGKG